MTESNNGSNGQFCDPYEDAKQAIIAAKEAFMTLGGEEKKRVIREVFGIDNVFSVIKIIQDFLR